MKFLEEKIISEGTLINDDILKVDTFLNHQIDIKVVREFGKFIKEKFAGMNINKVLTIETSGVAFAIGASEELGDVPVVFAKKSKSKIVDTNNVYTAQIKSFTRNVVSDVIVDKRFLSEKDNVLIIDDFLAEGNASLGLLDLCNQAKANVVGIGIVIEKGFQGGREKLEALGCKVESAAIIKAFKNGKIVFED